MNGWEQLPLRRSCVRDAPGIGGAAVRNRAKLSSDLPPGSYRWAVDEAGIVWVAIAPDSMHTHASIVPDGAAVRGAGHLIITTTGTVHLNCRSGHFMVEQPYTPQEQAIFKSLMVAEIANAGLTPGMVDGDMAYLPRPS